jgi:hypothetical protein
VKGGWGGMRIVATFSGKVVSSTLLLTSSKFQECKKLFLGYHWSYSCFIIFVFFDKNEPEPGHVKKLYFYS